MDSRNFVHSSAGKSDIVTFGSVPGSSIKTKARTPVAGSQIKAKRLCDLNISFDLVYPGSSVKKAQRSGGSKVKLVPKRTEELLRMYGMEASPVAQKFRKQLWSVQSSSSKKPGAQATLTANKSNIRKSIFPKPAHRRTSTMSASQADQTLPLIDLEELERNPSKLKRTLQIPRISIHKPPAPMATKRQTMHQNKFAKPVAKPVLPATVTKCPVQKKTTGRQSARASSIRCVPEICPEERPTANTSDLTAIHRLLKEVVCRMDRLELAVAAKGRCDKCGMGLRGEQGEKPAENQLEQNAGTRDGQRIKTEVDSKVSYVVEKPAGLRIEIASSGPENSKDASVAKSVIENAHTVCLESVTENAHTVCSESVTENAHTVCSESVIKNAHTVCSESVTENAHTVCSESVTENAHTVCSESVIENAHTVCSESDRICLPESLTEHTLDSASTINSEPISVRNEPAESQEHLRENATELNAHLDNNKRKSHFELLERELQNTSITSLPFCDSDESESPGLNEPNFDYLLSTKKVTGTTEPQEYTRHVRHVSTDSDETIRNYNEMRKCMPMLCTPKVSKSRTACLMTPSVQNSHKKLLSRRIQEQLFQLNNGS